jgi:hypothetical protein
MYGPHGELGVTCVCVYQCWVLLELYGSGSKNLN